MGGDLLFFRVVAQGTAARNFGSAWEVQFEAFRQIQSGRWDMRKIPMIRPVQKASR